MGRPEDSRVKIPALVHFTRLGNKIHHRFVGISQFMVFSNNNEYDDSDVEPIQGAFYASSSYKRMFFSKLREQREEELKAKMKAIDSENEAFILIDANLISIKGTAEFASSLSEDSSTNRIITSLYTKQGLFLANLMVISWRRIEMQCR